MVPLGHVIYNYSVFLDRQFNSAELAVESQEVVRIETRASDGRNVIETTMRTVPVVVMKPGMHLIVAER